MTEELLLGELRKKNIKVNKIIGNLDWAEVQFSNGIIVHFDGYISDDEERAFDGSLEGMVFSTRMHKGKREFSDCAEDFFDIESPNLIIELARSITEYTKGKVSFSDFDSFSEQNSIDRESSDDIAAHAKAPITIEKLSKKEGMTQSPSGGIGLNSSLSNNTTGGEQAKEQGQSNKQKGSHKMELSNS